MKSSILGIALFVATAAAVAFYPSVLAAVTPSAGGSGKTPPIVEAQTERKRIEVVFVLDTTASMKNLIQAAKENIWSIATTMAQSPAAPDIRMGLVGFRDLGDAYVTRVVDLSQDLDSVYGRLMEFRAEGGGDGPEHVNAALEAAIDDISWSDPDDTYQVVFLVGDAPPHMDYAGRQYPELIGAARQKGIFVNTIRCGDDSATASHWQSIAALGGGDFFTVGQNGDAVAIASPFDDEIAALSRELDETRLVFGSADTKSAFAAKQAATDKMHAEASAATRARRAAFNASESGADNLFGESDLVEAVTAGDVDLDAIAAAQLPAALQDMTGEERAAEVRTVQDRREDLNEQIVSLAKKRDEYVVRQAMEMEAVEDSLDYRIYDAVKGQAAGKGIVYESAAPKL